MIDHFDCDYCKKVFTRKYNLQIHIANCHMKLDCCCTICKQYFASTSGLYKHMQRGHNRFRQSNPECDVCGKIFKRRQNIMSHMITVHYRGAYPQIKCKFCDKCFTTDRNLKRHVNQLHNPYVQFPTCAYCLKRFKGKHSLISHIHTNHFPIKDPLKCHLCRKEYISDRNLKRHIDMFHGAKNEFKCELCPKVYNSNQSLKRHNRTRHTPDMIGAEIKCDTSLETHSLDYRPEIMDVYPQHLTRLKCGSCEKGFEEELSLRRHVKEEHSFETFYKYCKDYLLKKESLKTVGDSCKCDFCIYTFANAYDLKEHMRIKHDKEYSLSTCNVCFSKFFSKEMLCQHKMACLPPPDVNTCRHCDKLFTVVTSLEFHMRVFHPMSQLVDTSGITSDNKEDNLEQDSSCAAFKCLLCERIYYSDRSLKHHIKLKHTTDVAVDCQYCGKICSNKYYLASHIKIVHTDEDYSKCDYCEKHFKSKRNIRRHIEYTHLGMKRYKCIECETLFKEKRSLRKHVRMKHPNSMSFPQCHICQKRFESAKACKIHLKLVHSFNMNTHPCHLCSVSFTSFESLRIHIQNSHSANDEIYKCEECNLVFKGQDNFDNHNETYHIPLAPNVVQKILPRCIICIKDFSTRKTLKRHIKRFHSDFDGEELANYGMRNRGFSVNCEECLKKFNDEFYYNLYWKLKHLRDTIVFSCEACSSSYTSLEYSIQRYKMLHFDDDSKGKMSLSELCTTEMSDEEPESPMLKCEVDVKAEPVSP